MSSAELSIPAAAAESLGVIVDEVSAVAREEAVLAARKAQLIADAHRASIRAELAMTPGGTQSWSPSETARRILVSELACALKIPERTAEALVADSDMLVNHLPLTFDSLSRGAISWRHAQLLVEQVYSLPETAWAQFETQVLPFAEIHTAAQFKRNARVVRELMHPESIEQRHDSAVEKRSIDLQPAPDGMAYLTAYLPGAIAHAIFNRLDHAAARARDAGDDRTVTQLRVDALQAALLGCEHRDAALLGCEHGAAETPDLAAILSTIRPHVQITVPVLTLLGNDHSPATLDGYGPIDVETARFLTANAPSLTRLLTHPETGAVLSVGRHRYRVPEELRRWLQARDETCRFPGCSKKAQRCHLDHTQEWHDGGETAHNNLAHLCESHHRLKTLTDWNVEQLGHGVLRWTSPFGHVYVTEPAVRFAA